MPATDYKFSPFIQKLVFILLILLLLFTPLFTSPLALLAGLAVGLMVGNPFPVASAKGSKYILQAAVVGLGFGINLYQVTETGLSGLIYTFVSLTITMVLGIALGRTFGIAPKLTHLISAGTAICGGSAIAAVAPAIKASAKEISVALGIVFILNALALFIFPEIGYSLQLSQQQFGLWAAIAIHDTSSVVGAASRYGDEALQLATTLKLTRALWIVPLVLVSGLIFKSESKKVSIPVFILLFILASVLITFVPAIKTVSPFILFAAKKALLLSLFLIGANLNMATIRSISARPFYQGFILWVLIAFSSLFVIYFWG
ncbi:YeiH family protein [Pontibacter cellulosilyticus]|uniref:Sulfate exporter family transporter n=1 Tax=Pontibacter cellulosilyticus TaxID=1720253 RepID=A0A923N6J2_9BACT|nr:putative sulfate exporter family transporter [Pontibacter cellulosilyticus]MBC5992652.1 putative sulfate exporter family transporter [Pontibacter cellulosilyticus]